jgi:PAS domain S-box-containing protein
LPHKNKTFTAFEQPAIAGGPLDGIVDSGERAATTASAHALPPIDLAALEEAAADAVSLLSDSADQFLEISTRLLTIAQRATGAITCALFRTVHDTGLLVPGGRSPIHHVKQAESQRLVNAIARAADTTASVFSNNVLKKGVLDSAYSTSKRVFHRRVPGPSGVTIYGMAIVRSAPHIRPSAGSDGSRAEAGNPLLGVWLAVIPAPPATDPAAEMDARHSTEIMLRRMHVYFRLLCKQQSLLDAVDTAYRQTDKRLREVATIYEIGQAVDNTEIAALLDLITQKAATVMDAQACSLMLKDETTDQLVIAASSGLPDEVVENTRVFIGQGIAGRVAETGEPLLVNLDVRHDPRFQDSHTRGLPGISSSIVMPMKNEWDAVTGILCIRRRTPAPPFTTDDERLFSIFASQASMAIKNARLYGQLRSRVKELSTLSQLTEAISSTLDPDDVLNQVADNLIQIVGFDRCLIYLRGDEDHEPAWTMPRIMRGFDVPLSGSGLDALWHPEVSELIVNIAERQVPVLVEGFDHSLPIAREYADALGIPSFYAQPIIVRNQTIGVVVVTTDITGRPLALANMDLLVTFLQHAGIAIENARLYKQMDFRVKELNSLYIMSRSLATTYGLNRSCATVNRVAGEISNSDIAILMLFNDRLDALRIHSVNGAPDVITNLLRVLPDATDVARSLRLLREPTVFSPRSNAEQRNYFGKSWTKLGMTLEDIFPNLIIVPLVTEEASVGYLLLGRIGDRPYQAEAEKLVSIVSSHAAAVLRSAAVYEHSIEQRVLELSALYEISKKVRSARSMRDAFNAIIDIVRSVVHCDAAYIYVVEPEFGEIRVQAWHADAPPDTKTEELETSETIAAWVGRERKALLTADVTSDPRFPSAKFGPSVRSLMVIPIVLADETLGVLQVQSTARNMYSEDNVKMLSLIATQAAALYREMQSLRELTTYTENIVHSIAAGVVTLDAAGRIVTFNQAAERILRLDSRSVTGMRFDEMVPLLMADTQDEADTMKLVEMAHQTGNTVQRHRLRYYSSSRSGEGVAVETGDEVIVNGSASPLRSERGDDLGVVLVFEDITKEQEMEDELQRISRLAEIGQLAAGIAHELRNPLASIKGAAQVLKEDLPDDAVERHGEFLDIIVNEVNVLNGITSEFLEFSRPARPQPVLVDINELVTKRLAFLRAEFEQADIAVRQILTPDLPAIAIDPGMMDRAITNIVLNAVHAMPDGGLLTVETRLVGRGADAALEVGFKDTGIGIDPARRPNIFTPFFTTKTKGTGLGLAIVQQIMDNHDGRVRVQSAPGEGSTFTLWLPLSSRFRDKASVTIESAAEIAEQRLHAASRARKQRDDVNDDPA